MSDQETRTRPGVRQGSGQGPGMFHQAVSILQAEHHIAQIVAYEMLVDCAVRAGTSVREAAKAVIERSAAPA